MRTRGRGDTIAPGARAQTCARYSGSDLAATTTHEGSELAESVTITDNRTGESIEIPIVNGGVDATQWSKLLPGTWFYDPSFGTTAAASSAITYRVICFRSGSGEVWYWKPNAASARPSIMICMPR